MLNAATIIAKQTSALCNSCRVASSKTSNAVAKRHFVQSAKDVANNTAALVRAIKVNIEIDSTWKISVLGKYQLMFLLNIICS